jgi:hypothetical protein
MGDHGPFGYSGSPSGVEKGSHVIPFTFHTLGEGALQFLAFDDRPQNVISLDHDNLLDVGYHLPVRKLGEQFFAGDQHGGE